MRGDMTLEELLRLQGCDTVRDLFGYINYLEDVKADYEYLKSKLKCLVGEIHQLY